LENKDLGALKMNSVIKLLSISLAVAFCASALAQAPTSTPKGVSTQNVAAPSASTHYWYDGQTKRSLDVDTDHVIHFKPNEKAVLVKQVAGLSTEKSVLNPNSPVFKDGGTRRALPGGVIVTFAGSLSDDQAMSQLKAKGLEPLRRIGSSDSWLVASPAGLASLELANQLHESKAFAAAQPNWWSERAKK
jgi:hypothetical protein